MIINSKTQKLLAKMARRNNLNTEIGNFHRRFKRINYTELENLKTLYKT